MLNNKLLLFILLFVSISLVHAQPTEEDNPLPNIVLMFIDDLGYGDLGCYGHPTIRTPHLDQMAYEGIKLTSFYVAASVCTPSRAALMTGRYPLNAGLPGNLGPDSEGGLPLDERTLAEALKEVGYRTAAYGKWHLGAVPDYMPTDRGFDEYLGLLYSNDMMPPWVNTERPLQLYRNDRPIEQEVDQTTLTQQYTEAAIDFIQSNQEQPFFIYLAHSMPHLPIYASADYQGKSAGGDYGDVIEEIDSRVGQIAKVLEAEGLTENTLFIFTSDNGPWRNMPERMYTTEPVEPWHGGSTGPLAGAKGTSYEGGFRVPALLRWPGQIPAAQVSPEVCTSMDLHATILKLAGAQPAPKPLDGIDILPLLTEQAPSPRNDFYYFSGEYLDAVRDNRWKLRIAAKADDWISHETMSGDEPTLTELFDLHNDPFEQFNLAKEHPEHVARLRKKMQQFAKETGSALRE
ncbi:sulfatase family protein [Tunicatimonas pelagia]|uniref:sulfatase family protein n=1 Tax=Tunicatimonas pelagia TaxID=931531 RepID=UPI00266685AE|nr:sulfatase [Tunicatimonas pelagia]WKN45455.1 sulfatase [Tunicatimonas pelagia]